MPLRIVLYDLANRQNQCWSPNPWKTRFILNLKGLEYETKWLELPDIESHLKSLGIPPTSSGGQLHSLKYTVPAIRTVDGGYIMDSWEIAKHLEEKYPAPEYPAMHLDSPLIERVKSLVFPIISPLRGVILKPASDHVLNPASIEYYNQTRARMFGGESLEALEDEYGGEKGWEAARGAIKEFADLLQENDGPFIGGREPQYADAFVMGLLEWFRRQGGGVWERFQKEDEVFGKAYEAYGPWLKKND